MTDAAPMVGDGALLGYTGRSDNAIMGWVCLMFSYFTIAHNTTALNPQSAARSRAVGHG
jgi:hypothetical protein